MRRSVNLILVGILILSACKKKEKYAFEKIACYSNDSIRNKVFKPCREYIFRATYWHYDHSLISDDYVWMMATGKRWEYQPDLQDEIIIQYSFDSAKTQSVLKKCINLEVASQPWQRKVTTGIIETTGSIWMHPFRQNQYAFTEVAGFPNVRFPLEIGKTWNSNLSIYEGWGEWTDTDLNTHYEVVDYNELELPIGKVDAWHIKSYTIAKFGNIEHDFWFSEQLGFVKHIIKNYEDQLLVFELVEWRESG